LQIKVMRRSGSIINLPSAVDKRKARPIPQTPAEITTQHHRFVAQKAKPISPRSTARPD
jgi:hypothetical protein